MNSKIFGLLALSFFALVLVMGFGSAEVIFSDDFSDGLMTGWNLAHSGTGAGWVDNGTVATADPVGTSSIQRTISTVGFENIAVSYSRMLENDWEDGDEFRVLWSADGTNFVELESIKGVSGGGDTTPSETTFTTNPLTISNTSAINNLNFALRFECNTGTSGETCNLDNVVVTGDRAPTEVLSCSATGNPGNLDIDRIDLTNNGMDFKTFGDDDEWFPYESVDVEMRIENNNNTNDVNDIEVSWGLWDTVDKKWVIDFDREDTIDLRDDDSETLTVSFKIDDKDLEVDLDELGDSSGRYRLYVVADGNVDDASNTATCASDFDPVSMVIERDFVILDNFQYPDKVQCKETFTLTADAINVGDRDQEDVYVLVSNKDIIGSTSKRIDLGDIDQFDKTGIIYDLIVPEGLIEKTYILQFYVYDEDNELFQNRYDDEDAVFNVPLTVKGNCDLSGKAAISANLQSGGKAGQNMAVRVTITNTAAGKADFTLSVSGYADWADSATLDTQSVSLEAGQSRDVLVNLAVNRDAEGQKSFNIDVVSGTQSVISQPVTVDIEPRSFLGITGNVFSNGGGVGGNAYLWTIVVLNVLLVGGIIFVAVRLLRR